MDSQHAKHTPQLQSLFKNGRQIKLPKGQSLHYTDESMWMCFVHTGYVKRYSINADGSQNIQSIYGAGDVFPLTPLFKELFDFKLSTSGQSLFYAAVTESIVKSIDKKTMMDAINKDGTIYKELFYVAGVRLSSNIQRLESISLRSSYKRVANQLAFYAEKFGSASDDNSVVIDLPLTHQTLSEILALARETVTQAMLRLEEKQLISTGRNITVHNIDALKKEVW